MQTSTSQHIIPHGYFSYFTALLAAQALIDKITGCCIEKPIIIGSLAARKDAVRKLELSCVPIIEHRPCGLFFDTTNKVVACLSPRYKHIVPDTHDPITEISFAYMLIPTTIHFKFNEENYAHV